MSAILRFIEAAGFDSSLRAVSAAELQNAMIAFDIDSTSRAVLASGETGALVRMLGANPTMACLVATFEDEEARIDIAAVLRELELAGRDSTARRATAGDLESLVALLGARTSMVCGLAAFDDEADAMDEQSTAPASCRAA